MEGPRFLLELQAFFLLAPWLLTAPSGDGHPVMVLPGLSANDRSTLALRLYLRSRGYSVYGWRAGANFGLRRAGGLEKLTARLRALKDRHSSRVSLIGFSLGGTQARRVAASAPELVRRVMSVGSPLPTATSEERARTWRLYENVGGSVVGRDVVRRLVTGSTPVLPMHAVTIRSRSDGVVGARATYDPSGENIEVVSGHYGMLVNPAVFYALADRLAQPEVDWQPFSPPTWQSLFYPEPDTSGRGESDPAEALG